MWPIFAALGLLGTVVGIVVSKLGHGEAVPIPPSQRKMHLLRKGTANAEVSVWRGIVGLSTNSIDFDDETADATAVWQHNHGLTADKIVGRDSWKAAGYGYEDTPPKSAGVPKVKAPGSSDATNAQVGPSSGVQGGGGEGGHPWAATLPLEDTMAQGAILDAVRQGFGIVEWIPLTLTDAAGHSLTIQVTARALRVGTAADSVAVALTYGNQQAIADFYDAYLLTPHVVDAIFHAADLKILPYPNRNSWVTDGTMGHTDRMVQHSDAMDQKGVLSAKLVANEGKHWVIALRIWNDPDPVKRSHGPNYGWNDANGVPVQHVGLAHGRHSDYSQKGMFMRRKAMLDGNEVDLEGIVKDPALAGLISDEGPLPALRHPNWANL